MLRSLLILAFLFLSALPVLGHGYGQQVILPQVNCGYGQQLVQPQVYGVQQFVQPVVGYGFQQQVVRQRFYQPVVQPVVQPVILQQRSFIGVRRPFLQFNFR